MNEVNQQEKEQTGRRWFEAYCNRTSSGAHQPPVEGARYVCPCCGYPTLPQRGGYDICELCNWEDDGQCAPHADEVWGGPNYQYSLTQARENFKRFWIMYDSDDAGKKHLFNSPAALEAKKALAAAFDAMPEANEAEQSQLWNKVKVGEAVLEQELHNRVNAKTAAYTKADALGIPNTLWTVPDKIQIVTRFMNIEELEAEIPFIAETFREMGIDAVSVRYWDGEVKVNLADLAAAFDNELEDPKGSYPLRWKVGSSDFEIYNDAVDTEVELCHENHIHVRSNDDATLNKFRSRWERRNLNPPDLSDADGRAQNEA